MENKKRYISCGTCNKKYFYLILGAFITFMALGILNIPFMLYFSENNVENNFNIINIMSYTFFSGLCESFMIIPDLILKRKIKSEKNYSSKKKPNSNISIKYIFHPNTASFSLKEKIYFVSVALLKLILDIIFILYQYYFSKFYLLIMVLTYYFHFELICLFLLSKLMFNTKYYRHQYFSIIVLVVVGLVKFILYFFDKGLGYFFIHLLIHLTYSSFKSVLTVYMKGIMEYKYMTPYKACYLMGIINFIITTIVYIIVTFYPCDNTLCKVEYNNKKYFGNILAILNYSNLFTLGGVLIKTILLVLTYIVINDFSVCHSFLIGQMISIMEFGSYGGLNFFISTIGIILSFISLFFILLFLEIIEINIYKLNYNFKKYIERRATDDNLLAIINDDNSIDEKDM